MFIVAEMIISEQLCEDCRNENYTGFKTLTALQEQCVCLSVTLF